MLLALCLASSLAFQAPPPVSRGGLLRLKAERFQLDNVPGLAAEYADAFKANIEKGFAEADSEIQLLAAGQVALVVLLLVGIVPIVGDLLELVAGPGLILGGLGLLGAGLYELGPTNFSPFATPVQENELKTTGVYAFSRHPMYTGIMLFGIGAAVLTNSFQRLIIAGLLYLLMNYKVSLEEEKLGAIHPAYEAYQSNVPKFLPDVKTVLETTNYFTTDEKTAD
ncbi:hypothetical protein CTAYLR_010403 [Chrysophaeum taylorii]|uniref:Protein-S-isoprenylcysteine O-methyltransferase n=1 Tax=Chrysophaeum taylorii TaxID=2483200 RepID=A0AAD7XP73_9STRA|nr:hypothetical protein CTAYLR_010403 [Chrysophaeum taylorii]